VQPPRSLPSSPRALVVCSGGVWGVLDDDVSVAGDLLGPCGTPDVAAAKAMYIRTGTWPCPGSHLAAMRREGTFDPDSFSSIG
jgi:hypothetical protein